MPRETQLRSAQRSRDDAMARLRTITFWSGAGAAGLTIVASLVAATTIPGRSDTSTTQSSTSSSPATQGGGDAPAAVPTLDPNVDPGQQAQPVPQVPNPSQFQQGPAAVSGGS